MRRWILPVAMASVLAGTRPAASFTLPPGARLHALPTLAAKSTPAALRSQLQARPGVAAPQLQLRMVAANAGDAVKIVGPEWNNDDEYSSLDSVELKADLTSVSELIDELSLLASNIDMANLDKLSADVLVQITRKSTEAVVKLMNVATFASCASSVDGSNLEARSLQATVRSMSSKMTQATQSAALAIKLAPEEKIVEYLAQCPEEKFNVEVRHVGL